LLDYLAEQQALHQNPDYGVASVTYAPLVAEIMDHDEARLISDYGAGKYNLHKKMYELGKLILYISRMIGPSLNMGNPKHQIRYVASMCWSISRCSS